MQELTYQLQKEDYKDWIHWNVGRQKTRKMQIITFIIYIAFLVLYLGGSIAAGRGLASIFGMVIIAVLLGIFMFRAVSPKHQEEVIYKKSGLARLEKQGGFPTVHLTVREDGVTMEVPGEVVKEYYFSDLNELEEIDRLFLMGASDKTWQFIAKSAFESQEQMDEFKTYMREKIADAKENPEKYRKLREEAAQLSKNQEIAGAAEAPEEDSAEEDAVEIELVNTSKMGKIGKMAHIMAAMALENETEGQNSSGEQAEESEDEALKDSFGSAEDEALEGRDETSN